MSITNLPGSFHAQAAWIAPLRQPGEGIGPREQASGEVKQSIVTC